MPQQAANQLVCLLIKMWNKYAVYSFHVTCMHISLCLFMILLWKETVYFTVKITDLTWACCSGILTAAKLYLKPHRFSQPTLQDAPSFCIHQYFLLCSWGTVWAPGPLYPKPASGEVLVLVPPHGGYRAEQWLLWASCKLVDLESPSKTRDKRSSWLCCLIICWLQST